MPREVEPSINESQFLHHALSQGLRLDSRQPYELRTIELDFLRGSLGAVECRLGQTRVLAQVSAEIVRPLPDRPYEGFLNVSTELSPMASTNYEAGRTSDEQTLLTRLLEKTLRRSECVDREALCIVAGQRVWSIRVDVHFLDDQGNLLDCASIAAITALRHFRKPDVQVVGEEVIVVSRDTQGFTRRRPKFKCDVLQYSMTERVPVLLAIHHTPICLTFAFFGDDSTPLLDPSLLESQLCSGTLTLTLNAQQEICVLSKAGGAPLPADDIMKVVMIGTQRVKEVDAFIKKELERDEKRRRVEVR
ncbi:BZ3500_MvSof-1268-A1-R1_Chr8-1g09808 [Microbotryum saponariae]|uniref:BZ3500_MvSof-1268-A1-R1_Chr8-1g09808 protein n=1 Tax=Microbotryum saponariae TaxID=289078 RepID=A0A2X0LIA0_9BASI|nr:BZ3500_MvSof-1268-A1-R1_Chr8-1g09808 [Microbotryum saponariae]SDA08094.1 BZ3501_MvSof-1269-A2-R1_Chr8-1g09531 [Microbotryum saponariae]